MIPVPRNGETSCRDCCRRSSTSGVSGRKTLVWSRLARTWLSSTISIFTPDQSPCSRMLRSMALETNSRRAKATSFQSCLP